MMSLFHVAVLAAACTPAIVALIIFVLTVTGFGFKKRGD